jgi:ribonucleotide reductase alpha subunit
MKLKVSFESEKALDINERIFETIYFAACEASYELALKEGSYSSF